MSRASKLLLEVVQSKKKPPPSKLKDFWKVTKTDNANYAHYKVIYEERPFEVCVIRNTPGAVVGVNINTLKGKTWSCSVRVSRTGYKVYRSFRTRSVKDVNGKVRALFPRGRYAKSITADNFFNKELEKKSSPFTKWFGSMVKLGDTTKVPVKNGRTTMYVVNPKWSKIDRFITYNNC